MNVFKIFISCLKPNKHLFSIIIQNVKKAIISTTATPTKNKIFQSPKVVKGMFAGVRINI